MHICIDARAYNWTGIGRYIRSLLIALAHADTEHKFSVLIPKGAERAFSVLAPLPSPQFSLIPVDGSYYSWREQVLLPLELSRIDADVFHFTHFNVPMMFHRPYVVTVHDVTRFFFPGETRPSLFRQLAYERVFSNAVARAKHVVFVSRATEQDFDALGFMVRKASRSVIPEAVDVRFFEPALHKELEKIPMLLGTHDPYLLFVGVWMSHKNIDRLLIAFSLLREKYPEYKLVITGKPKPGYRNITDKVREMGLENAVIFPGFVSHELLSALYARASVFMFPSLYEGFGLPPLEAMAAGVPVVSSNVSSMPEVLGDAAWYVNPEDPQDIARGIEDVLSDDLLRERLVDAGHIRARGFSWDVVASEHLRVYEQQGKL